MDSDHPPLVVHVVNRLEGGGTERVLKTFVRSADRVRFRHALVTLREAGSFCGELPSDVRVCALATKGVSRLSGFWLARVLRRWKPAIVHARGAGCWSDTIVGTTLAGRIPAVLGFHGLEKGSSFTPNQVRAARWACRLGATFASVSRAGIEMMKDQLGISPEIIQHLPNGVDHDRFVPPRVEQRMAVRNSLGISPSSVVVGSVASLTPIKRHDLIIDALCRVRRLNGDVSLLVVGGGALRSTLAERARRQGAEEQVHFLGHRERVAELYHAMDMYVCASDSEGVSNSVLEAMSCGLPVVTTRVGDHGILIRDGVEGVVVASGSASALADGMWRILSSPAGCERMRRSARLRACAMDLGDMVTRHEQLYARLALGESVTKSPLMPAGSQPGEACVGGIAACWERGEILRPPSADSE